MGIEFALVRFGLGLFGGPTVPWIIHAMESGHTVWSGGGDDTMGLGTRRIGYPGAASLGSVHCVLMQPMRMGEFYLMVE